MFNGYQVNKNPDLGHIEALWAWETSIALVSR
jgi:hypothetical protein